MCRSLLQPTQLRGRQGQNGKREVSRDVGDRARPPFMASRCANHHDRPPPSPAGGMGRKSRPGPGWARPGYSRCRSLVAAAAFCLDAGVLAHVEFVPHVLGALVAVQQ